MIEVGKFYTLKRDLSTVGYHLSDHYDPQQRKEKSEVMTSAELEIPFMILDMHFIEDKINEFGDEDFWILIMSQNKVGWINVDRDQLRKYITYSR